jgi:hypothetical protein
VHTQLLLMLMVCPLATLFSTRHRTQQRMRLYPIPAPPIDHTPVPHPPALFACCFSTQHRQGSSLYSDAVPLSPCSNTQGPAAAAAAGTGSSPARSSSVLGGTTLTRTATTTNSILCGVLPPERGQPPEKKTGPRQIVNGQTWGQYDPIRHQWKVPPVNPVYKDQEILHDKRCFTSGTHSKRVHHMEARGVWNPISATWTIAPARGGGYPRPASALA